MKNAILVSLAVALAACGTSSSPPSPAPSPAPATPEPAAPPSIPHSGAGAPAGTASAALLAIIEQARTRKVRMTVDTTRAGATHVSHMVLEVVPPDRRHSTMDLTAGPRTTHVETIMIGQNGWMKMGEGAWRPTPQPSMAIGTASAQTMIDEMVARIQSGQVQVTDAGMVSGMHAFRIDAAAGVVPGGGAWAATLFVGGNGLPDHVDGTVTGGPMGDSTTHQAFVYDDSLQIEAPL